MSCAVIDVGKTHVRVGVLDEAGTLLAQRRRANEVVHAAPYPHFDVDGAFAWMVAALRELGRELPIRHLICTTHGASGALLAGERLALPVMDYEWTGPDIDPAPYEASRDPFAASLSPALPAGLNLARQAWWQAALAPAEFAAADVFLPYAQYWAWRFCGVAASEVSSLGSHTDLWRPLEARPSQLAEHLGIARRLPPLRHAGAVLGRLDARRTGLGRELADIEVHCGVHDSSAAYVAQYPEAAAPGVSVSTGTWIVCMAPLRDAAHLDPRRDTSGTVSVHGMPLACSRFMGGREFAALAGAEGATAVAGTEDALALLRAGTLALPPHAPSGPYQHAPAPGRILGPPPQTAAQRSALAALYCALVTDVCLEQIEARGAIVVDGPFSANALYLGALAALRAPDAVSAAAIADGPTRGAAILATGGAAFAQPATRPQPPLLREELLACRRAWRAAIQAHCG